MKILIVGTGYVGLVTGACFAEMGHNVLCLDIDTKKIDLLNDSKIPFYEPGMQELVTRNRKAKRLFFTTSYEEGLLHGEVCFICVPTPSSDDGSCNLHYVETAARQLAKNISSYKVIVNKSTVPMGSAAKVRSIIIDVLKKRKIKIEFDVVSNPEFLKEGSAIQDCMRPDRIIIGSDSERAKDLLRSIYAPFMINHERFLEMDIPSAELTKYAANAMLATRISFMNEIAEISKAYNANIHNVRKGIGSDPRIGQSFLYAGVGYGGSCFPKDVRALSHMAKEKMITPRLLNAVEEINIAQKKSLSKSVMEYFSDKGGVKGKSIAVWGLSFKPDTDDLREAPSLIFIDHLQKEGAILRLYDPICMEKAKTLLTTQENLIWCDSEFEAADGAHAIALLTEWKQFRLVDFEEIQKKMHHFALFDGRNQYKPQEMKQKGFDYIGIGVSLVN